METDIVNRGRQKEGRAVEASAYHQDRPVPTEADWGDYTADLDQEYAHRVFAGKTVDEAQADFRENVIERTDELRFMPAVPFQYYVMGLRDFVLRGPFDGVDAPSAAGCFLSLVAEKLRDQPDRILPVMPELMPAVEHLAAHQADYDADPEIFGDFSETFQAIRDRYQDLLRHPPPGRGRGRSGWLTPESAGRKRSKRPNKS